MLCKSSLRGTNNQVQFGTLRGLVGCVALLVACPASSFAQPAPPQVWSFLASGPADGIIPAATPDGGVVIVVPERLNPNGVRVAPPRIQKITSSGELAWQQDLTWNGIGWPIVLDDGSTVVAEGSVSFGVGRLHCVEPGGQIRWTIDPGGSPVIAPSVRPNGRIMTVVTPRDLLWISPGGEIESRKPLGYGASGQGISMADGQFLLTVGTAVCSVNDDGEVLWYVDLPTGTANTPAVAPDGTVVVTTTLGSVVLLNPDGSQRYSDWPGVELAAPVVGRDGMIYIPRSDKKLEVRDRRGALVRRVELPDTPGVAPALGEDGRLWLTLKNGQLVAYSPTGDLVAAWTGPGFSGGAPLLMTGGRLVAGYHSREVIAFGEAGDGMSVGWPLLGGNQFRNGIQQPIQLPKRPVGLTVLETNYNVRISWEPSDELVTYEVWRNISDDFSGATRLAAFLVECGWTDDRVVSGYEYWYWVRARNAAGTSEPSAPVRFRRDIPPAGSVVAMFKLADGPLATPSVGPDGTIYVGDSRGGLTALAPEGTTKWHMRAQFEQPLGCPAISPDGAIYVSGAEGVGITCVSSNGTIVWQHPYLQPGPPVTPALDNDGNVVCAGRLGDEVYLVSISPKGQIKRSLAIANVVTTNRSSVMLGSGNAVWLVKTGVDRYGGDLTFLWGASLAPGAVACGLGALDVGGEVLVGMSGTNCGLVRFASDGTVVWRVGTNDVVSGAVIDADGIAYFGDVGGCFHAVSRGGDIRWSVDLGASVSCTPALGEPDLVYAVTKAGCVIALDRLSGAERWRFVIGSEPTGELVVTDWSELLLGTASGELYRIRVAGGAPANAVWPMFGRNAGHDGRLPEPMPALGQPIGVAATQSATNTEIIVTWSGVPGAVWYDIRRAPTNDAATAVTIATNLTCTHSFTDYFVSGDRAYWYWVRAGAPDEVGPWSESVMGYQGARKWRVAPGGTIHGPPAVSDDGVVYVALHKDDQVYLVALSGVDGSELWRRKVGPPATSNISGGPPPVLTTEGNVIVAGQWVLACFSRSGELLWERQGYQCEAISGMALTRSGLLVVPGMFYLTAWNARDGQLLWELELNLHQRGGPAIARDGTIWVLNSAGSAVAVQPNGKLKLQVAAKAIGLPGLSKSGHMLLRDSSLLLKLVAPDGSMKALGTAFRARISGLASAEDLLTFATYGAQPEMITVNTNGDIVSRVRCAPITPGDYVIGADGTWYVYALNDKSIYALDAAGTVRTVWPLYRSPNPGDFLLGDDGTLYVNEGGTLTAFLGFGPPNPDAWALPRKDRRNSASWEDQMPRPSVPTGFTAEPTVSVNTASFTWQQPENLTVLEVWRSATPNFSDAKLIGRPLVTQTTYVDYDRLGGSTAYYWLRGLDLSGVEVGRVGPVESTTKEGPRLAWCVPVSSTGTPSLADDGTLYVAGSELSAYRPDGTVLWVQKGVSRYGSSPPVVAHDGTIFVWQGMHLYAVGRDGEIKWQDKLLKTEVKPAELAVSDRGLLVAAGAFGLRAYDLEGTVKWAVGTEAYTSVVLGEDQTVYATTQSKLLCCYNSEGLLRWTAEPTGVYAGGLALDDHGNVLAPGYDSRLRWLTPQGTVLATVELSGQPGEPVICADAVAASILRGTGLVPKQMVLMDPAGLFRTSVGLDNSSITAARDGTFLVSSQTNLVAVGSDGLLRWSYLVTTNTEGSVSQTVISHDGRIYFTACGSLWALDSALAPASTGWYNTRGNNRRTGQWMPPAQARPMFYGAKCKSYDSLDLWIAVPVGTTNELEFSTDFQQWVPVTQIVGSGGPTNLTVTISTSQPVGVFRIRTISGP